MSNSQLSHVSICRPTAQPWHLSIEKGPKGGGAAFKNCIYFSSVIHWHRAYSTYLLSAPLSHALPTPPAHSSPTFMPSSYPSNHTVLHYTDQTFVFPEPEGNRLLCLLCRRHNTCHQARRSTLDPLDPQGGRKQRLPIVL